MRTATPSEAVPKGALTPGPSPGSPRPIPGRGAGVRAYSFVIWTSSTSKTSIPSGLPFSPW